MGYDAEIINFLPKATSSSLRFIYRKTTYKEFRDKLGEIFNYMYDPSGITCRKQLFNSFRRHFMRIRKTNIRNISKLKEEIQKYDICIVGSDQIWNPTVLIESNFAYLLPFPLRRTRKVAFSASIASEIPTSLIKLYKIFLSDFDFISVREKSFCNMISSLVNKRVYNTLDPVLLSDKNEYEKIMNRNALLPYDYVLIYSIHDFLTVSIGRKVADTLKLPVLLIFTYFKPPLFPISLLPIVRKRALYRYLYCHSLPQVGPREFITLLMNAKFVVTNSYHGTVFSILFEKPFICTIRKNVVSNKFSSAQRFFSLLRDLNLENRAYIEGLTRLSGILGESIDYIYIKEIIKDMKKNSLHMLETALKG